MGHEGRPNARGALGVERGDAPLPAVEIGNHPDTARTRRPHGEMHPGNAGLLARDGAEFFVECEMRTLVEEVKVVSAE